jgi:hypothetical protein
VSLTTETGCGRYAFVAEVGCAPPPAMVLIVFTCAVALKLATKITAKKLRVRRILFPNIPAENEQSFKRS